jgi:hypothetical protein
MPIPSNEISRGLIIDIKIEFKKEFKDFSEFKTGINIDTIKYE